MSPGPLHQFLHFQADFAQSRYPGFFNTLAATPEPSLTNPKQNVLGADILVVERWASWLASCITFRARSVNRSYILVVSSVVTARRDRSGSRSPCP
jgi:hypothetical protein